MKNLIITHGDVDGVICAAIIKARVERIGEDIDVVFTQPFLINKIDYSSYDKVFVLDIAANNKNLQMTKDFINHLGQKLVMWGDHHKGWGNVPTDERFIIDDKAKSCASVIAREMSPEIQSWIEAANAVDSRQGTTELGTLLDQSSKVDLSDNSVRYYAIDFLLNKNNGSLLYQKQREYITIENKTKVLVCKGQLIEGVFVIDTRGETGFDRTQLFMLGYKQSPFVVVLGKLNENIETTIATNLLNINLVDVFGLSSGAPFRVGLDGDMVQMAIKKLTCLR